MQVRHDRLIHEHDAELAQLIVSTVYIAGTILSLRGLYFVTLFVLCYVLVNL